LLKKTNIEEEQLVLLCPYCMGTITENTEDCKHCGDDVRNDAIYELTTQQVLELPTKECQNCQQHIPKLSIKCRHCSNR